MIKFEDLTLLSLLSWDDTNIEYEEISLSDKKLKFDGWGRGETSMQENENSRDYRKIGDQLFPTSKFMASNKN